MPQRRSHGWVLGLLSRRRERACQLRAVLGRQALQLRSEVAQRLRTLRRAGRERLARGPSRVGGGQVVGEVLRGAGSGGRLRVGELEQFLLGGRDVLQSGAGIWRRGDLGLGVLEDLLHLRVDRRRRAGGGDLLLRGRDGRRRLRLGVAVGPALREHLVHRVREQHEGCGSHGHRDGQQHLAAPETDRVRGRELGPSRLLERVAPQGAVHRSGIQATLPRGRQPLLQPEPEVGGSHEADRSRAGGRPGHRDCGERDRHAECRYAQRLF